MEMIKTKKEMVESLKDLRAIEISARKDYLEDIESFNDIYIIEEIKQIKIDEDNHIKLIEELIEILSK